MLEENQVCNAAEVKKKKKNNSVGLNAYMLRVMFFWVVETFAWLKSKKKSRKHSISFFFFENS